MTFASADVPASAVKADASRRGFTSVICECGCLLLYKHNLKRHLQTNKHKQNMKLKANEVQVKEHNSGLKDVAASILQAYARAKIDANDLQPAIFCDLFSLYLAQKLL